MDVGGTTAWRQEVERRLERAPRATQAMARKAGGRTTQEQLSEQLPRKRSGEGDAATPYLGFCNEIVKGQRAVTADTALRLGRFFSMQPQFWLNLQTRHDMEIAETRLHKRLDREVKPLHAA